MISRHICQEKCRRLYTRTDLRSAKATCLQHRAHGFGVNPACGRRQGILVLKVAEHPPVREQSEVPLRRCGFTASVRADGRLRAHAS